MHLLGLFVFFCIAFAQQEDQALRICQKSVIEAAFSGIATFHEIPHVTNSFSLWNLIFVGNATKVVGNLAKLMVFIISQTHSCNRVTF